jgi:NAD/NADP transhydrogenase alpha subunit
MSNTTRRQFFTSLAAVSGALSANASSEKSESISEGFEEASMRLPLHSDADVIVCGAGPAGVTAAITAARAGSKVRQFERMVPWAECGPHRYWGTFSILTNQGSTKNWWADYGNAMPSMATE